MLNSRSLFTSISLFCFVGCGSKADDTADTGPIDSGTTSDETGEVRLAHFGVFPGDTGTDVDVFINGEASGITFGFKETTDFVELPVGAYDFDIVPAGGTIDDSVYSVEAFALEAGDQWSIFAAGYVAGGPGSAFLVGAELEDRSTIPAGKVRVQVVHAAAFNALSPVDVWVVDDMCAPVDPLVVGFEFASSGNFDLDSTLLNVGFDIGQDGTVNACFKIPDLGITDEIVSVYAVNTDAGAASLVAHLPDGTSAELAPE